MILKGKTALVTGSTMASKGLFNAPDDAGILDGVRTPQIAHGGAIALGHPLGATGVQVGQQNGGTTRLDGALRMAPRCGIDS